MEEIFPVNITDRAVEMILHTMNQIEMDPKTTYLYVGVVGGGCAGWKYNMDFKDSIPSDEWFVKEFGELKVMVDPISAGHLSGTTIRYLDGLQAGFKFDNPSAKKTCGCNKSFSV
jgi:iron-sulfur cluster assembly accessory protein